MERAFACELRMCNAQSEHMTCMCYTWATFKSKLCRTPLNSLVRVHHSSLLSSTECGDFTTIILVKIDQYYNTPILIPTRNNGNKVYKAKGPSMPNVLFMHKVQNLVKDLCICSIPSSWIGLYLSLLALIKVAHYFIIVLATLTATSMNHGTFWYSLYSSVVVLVN